MSARFGAFLVSRRGSVGFPQLGSDQPRRHSTVHDAYFYIVVQEDLGWGLLENPALKIPKSIYPDSLGK